MKIFGLNVSRKAAPVEVASRAQISDVNPQGPLSGIYQNYIFRKVSGDFYEKLREGIPIIDAGIRRLISLNGTIKIIGDNAACVRELEDFCLNVPVNDMQKGIHSFLENFSNEVFEQGFALSEFVATPDRKDIAGLRVADSKQIIFRRDEQGRSEPWYIYPLPHKQQEHYTLPGDLIDKLMNSAYEGTVIYGSNYNLIKCDMSNKLYFSINNENTNPYGVSMLRSMEFVSQILATLQNSVKSVAERFGDPLYHAHYKAGKSGGDLETRRKKLEEDFFAIISGKRQGYSGDLVTAGGPDSDVLIKVIGHEGQIMQYDVPFKHVLEQIVSKFNLPAWMLGLYWSSIGSKGSVEVECALQDAKIRQFAMLPEFIRLFSKVLKLRGRNFKTITTDIDKHGDWGIVFETPNVRDMVAQAQARFLNAQADQMQYIAGTQPIQTNVSIGSASMEIEGMKFPMLTKQPRATSYASRDTFHAIRDMRCEQHKELMRPIPWPELDKVEADYETELKFDWQELQGKVFSILGLDKLEGKNAELPVKPKKPQPPQIINISTPPIDVHLNIENNGQRIKKTVNLNRGEKGELSSAEIIEEVVNG